LIVVRTDGSISIWLGYIAFPPPPSSSHTHSALTKNASQSSSISDCPPLLICFHYILFFIAAHAVCLAGHARSSVTTALYTVYSVISQRSEPKDQERLDYSNVSLTLTGPLFSALYIYTSVVYVRGDKIYILKSLEHSSGSAGN
jgi:hypothetical protein